MNFKLCLTAALLVSTVTNVYAVTPKEMVGSSIPADVTVNVTAGGVITHDLSTVKDLVIGSDGRISLEPIATGHFDDLFPYVVLLAGLIM